MMTKNHLLELLENINKNIESDYWFITKQSLSDLYLVYNISKTGATYQREKSNLELFHQYYKRFFKSDNYLNANYKDQYESNDTYRNAIIGLYLGLFERTSNAYKDSTPTKSYDCISKYINDKSSFDKYKIIFERQIEKIAFNILKTKKYSEIKNVKIFGVVSIYKVLVLLYQSNKNECYITPIELAFFIGRMKCYEEVEKTIEIILNYRKYKDLPEIKIIIDGLTKSNSFDHLRYDSLVKSLSSFKSNETNIIPTTNGLSHMRYVVDLYEHSDYFNCDEDTMKIFLESDNYFIGKLDDNIVFIDRDVSKEENDMDKIKKSKNDFITHAEEHSIYYGTPGCGKSFQVQEKFCKEKYYERTIFHPEYSNVDFVGQIIPIIDQNGNPLYKFIEGPFTKALTLAYKNPNKEVTLIIEELNRGNAASIFGDIFQLLDIGEDGFSRYEIFNYHLTNHLTEKVEFTYDFGFDKIKLPSNFRIVATMNSSDQNVFCLDNAFQRRWNMIKIKNTFLKDGVKITKENLDKAENYVSNQAYNLSKMFIPGSSTTWKHFVEVINERIIDPSLNSPLSEDKQLGIYFISEKSLVAESCENNADAIRKFAEKVLKYIWDDIAKLDPEDWFISNCNSLDKVITQFSSTNLKIFTGNLFEEDE